MTRLMKNKGRIRFNLSAEETDTLGIKYIQKPFRSQKLAATVRTMLDEVG